MSWKLGTLDVPLGESFTGQNIIITRLPLIEALSSPRLLRLKPIIVKDGGGSFDYAQRLVV